MGSQHKKVAQIWPIDQVYMRKKDARVTCKYMVLLLAVSSENSVVGGTHCIPLSFFFINAKNV